MCDIEHTGNLKGGKMHKIFVIATIKVAKG